MSHAMSRIAQSSIRTLSASPPLWLRCASSTLLTTTTPLTNTDRSRSAPVRHSSHSPMGHPPSTQRKKVTLHTLNTMYKKGEPITMLTAHDFPSAHAADHAGIDTILVGDSLAMVALGHTSTSPLTLTEILLFCSAASRATTSAFLIGDLPMGSYESSDAQAVDSAVRMVKEGGVESVKLEGGRDMAGRVAAIAKAGIPVLAHVGLTPQRQSALGGFRVQGKTASGAMHVLRDALAVQEAGAWGVVLEAVPEEVAGLITKRLSVPTVGIGAGKECSGQVLVQMDMAGNFPPGRYLPKFVKRYGDVWGEASKAIGEYRREVKERSYPEKEYTYEMKQEEFEKFRELVDGVH